MKKPTRREPKPDQSQSPARTRGVRLAAAILLVACAGLGGWAWGRYSNSHPPPTQPASTRRPDPVAPSQIDFQKLTGRWQRTDGGYILEIRAVKSDGSLDAAYLNPRPINVAKAAASREGATLKVFVELRDKNYPGSTYLLLYDPQADQLGGIYFQAVERQQFEVAFVRMK